MPGCELQQSFANVVIRASAGTGKTFQLSNRFLALVHAGERPDHLIAATFARKAAGEILARVLVRLAEAATDPDKLRELAECIEADAGGLRVDAICCEKLLLRLVTHLHRLRIGTLDSLFVQMAGTFAFELGLPPGWRIVDEVLDRRLRDAAVQDVLANAPVSAVVMMMHLLNMGELRRSVSEQVRSVTDGMYSIFCEAAVDAWDCVPRPQRLDEAELRAAIERVAGFDGLPKGQRFPGVRASDVAAAEAGDWESFLSKGLAAKVAAGESSYHRKEIPGPLVDAYKPLVEHARAVLIGKLADQTRATCDLLQQFDHAYERLKHRQRALRFEDVTRALARSLGDGRLGELGFRMDLHACQLLLDEFQDTSLPQWQVLRPLAVRAAREPGRSFFCVGDVKQAIYGWRGGISELFDGLSQQLDDIKTQPLDQSFRSSPAVIEVVNKVFGSLADSPALDKYPRVKRAWAERFHAHSTARDLAGYVRLESAPSAGDAGTDQQRRLTLQHAAALAARLHREHPGCSIGILVRKNAAVARLIYELRQVHQLTASEEGGNPLTDSAGVELILSLLTLADHPGHTIARFHVARSPLGEALGFTNHEDGFVVRRLAREIRADLVHRGYGPTILDWVRKLAPACDTRELSRLTQLVALAYRYEADATERPEDFVRYIRATRVEDPLSADVRVMTVHQAKGLEFDIVILPELDGQFCGPPVPKVLVGRPEPTAAINAICRYPRAELRALLPARFGQMHGDWEYLEVNEDLCVLYVAMTRAVHALHLVVPPTNGKPPCTPAAVLCSALSPADSVPAGKVLYDHGTRNWYAREQSRGRWDGFSPPAPGTLPFPRPLPSGAREAVPVRPVLAQSPVRRRRGLDRHSPSGLQGGTVVRLKDRLFAEPSLAADRGTLWHAWLEQVGWLDDAEPDDEELLNVAHRLPTAGLDVPAELTAFRKLLETPTVRETLCRTAYTASAGGWPAAVSQRVATGELRLTVEREQRFAIREDNAVLAGAIDRLVLAWQDDRVVAADVLDFKTDQIAADERLISDKIAYYGPQVAGYRRAVAALYGLSEADITVRLVFLTPGVVRQTG